MAINVLATPTIDIEQIAHRNRLDTGLHHDVKTHIGDFVHEVEAEAVSLRNSGMGLERVHLAGTIDGNPLAAGIVALFGAGAETVLIDSRYEDEDPIAINRHLTGHSLSAGAHADTPYTAEPRLRQYPNDEIYGKNTGYLEFDIVDTRAKRPATDLDDELAPEEITLNLRPFMADTQRSGSLSEEAASRIKLAETDEEAFQIALEAQDLSVVEVIPPVKARWIGFTVMGPLMEAGLGAVYRTPLYTRLVYAPKGSQLHVGAIA